VIKTVLALEKGAIPPNANFEKLNPRIDLEMLRIEVH
jgi:acyl transferase domain-containing protein